MTNYTETFITQLEEIEMRDKLDIFTIYHIQNILGPHTELMDPFCTKVLQSDYLPNGQGSLKWQDVYGALKEAREEDKPFDEIISDFLRRLNSASEIANNCKILFVTMVKEARQSENDPNRAFPVYELLNELSEYKKDIDIDIDAVSDLLIQERLIRKNGSSLQLLVQAHHLVSENWLDEKLAQHLDTLLPPA